MKPRQVIALTEYQPYSVPQRELPLSLAQKLQQQYGPQVRVERNWAASGEPWRLTAQGWVGYIPLAPDLHLALQPKVPLENLFSMLEVAYRQPFQVLPGVVATESLPDFFERLAFILANRVLGRVRQGLYRAYLPRTERLPFVRGRWQLHRAVPLPGQVNLDCAFEEHTTDVADNRILLYTVWLLSRAVRRAKVRQVVQQAYRALHGRARLTPFTAADCNGRSYHRLNEDYQPMHVLCAFFLDQLGPAHQWGKYQSLPFLVDMARLFERFVAAWLGQHCPATLQLREQAPVNNPDVGALVDLVLTDAESGQVRCVLDTKYKLPPGKPAERDIYQVVAYAQDRDCLEAVLIYPAPLANPLDTQWGAVRVRSLVFNLSGNLDVAGQEFMNQLLV